MPPKARKKPAYEILYEEMKNDILTGKRKNGERLPSKRALAEDRGLSVVTVENAFAQLIAEGYAAPVQRSGYYVSYSGDLLSPAAPEPPERQLPVFKENIPASEKDAAASEEDRTSSGAAALFPFTVWARLMRTVILEQGTKLLKPVRQGGVFELRAAISDYLYRCRGMRVLPEQIVIGAGTEYLYNLLIPLLGRELCYAVEDPSYEITERIYRLNGVKTVRVRLDGQGMSAEALGESGANAAHISPAHHFPTGIVMPISRRREIMKWAEAAPERWIIEDDYDSEFRHTGRPVPAMFAMDASQRVLYVNTFSQTLAPSVRISYLCLPPRLLPRWRELLGFCACPVPSFEQYTLAKFISEGYFERHISRVRSYARRTGELTARLFSAAGASVHESGAGLHFLITVKKDAKALFAQMEPLGVKIRPISRYFGETARSTDYEDQYVVSYVNADEEKLMKALQNRE